MIAVDTSALMAIVLEQPEAAACQAALEDEAHVLISAATVAEALIVAARRGFGDEMAGLIDRLNFEIAPVTGASARRVAEIYDGWGKGVHPTALNFADCFAYEAARAHGCRLLYVGNDFARTDVEAVI